MELTKREVSLIHFSVGLMLADPNTRLSLSEGGIEEAEKLMDKLLILMKK